MVWVGVIAEIGGVSPLLSFKFLQMCITEAIVPIPGYAVLLEASALIRDGTGQWLSPIYIQKYLICIFQIKLGLPNISGFIRIQKKIGLKNWEY